MEPSIRTNHHWYELVSFCELPLEVQLSEDFDYIEDIDRPRLFKYKGHWYDVNEFFVEGAPVGWDAVQTDSFFSGTIIRYGNEETHGHDRWYFVQVGRLSW